ncbi:glycoside hydrolase family 3 N-terminal domain-containing protein [Candidatus Latescibacterota bacterium]
MIDRDWVENTLRNMSVEEKVGQLMFPRVYGRFYSADDEEYLRYIRWVEDYHLGGIELFNSDLYGAAFLLNRLQAASKYPLLVTCDAETGMAHRVTGTTHLTHNMGIGATGDEQLAYIQGKITALEGSALGVHVFEGPTVDVNVNPGNPIIAVRSFGDDPGFVASMGNAFIHGLQDHGMIACAKHFPGHGNTSIDSHMDLPVIDIPRDVFERTDLLPFREAIDAGVMGIMTAHINVPALDRDTEYPATLSHAVSTGLLRDEMGFDGLVISDSLMMDAITRYFPPGKAELMSVLAGTDILLVPFLDQAFETLTEAVRTGELPEERLDTSVRRILTAKSWCDLHEERFIDVNELHHRIGSEQTVMKGARRLTEKSVTLVKNENELLPVSKEDGRKILSIVYYDHPLEPLGESFQEEMRKRALGAGREFYEEGVPDESGNIQTITIGCNSDPAFEEEALMRAVDYDFVVCAFVYRIIMRRGTPNLRERAEGFVRRLTTLDVPVAVVSFGAPYMIGQAPDADAFVAAYMYSPLVQKATVKALFGEIPFEGKLPVKLG